MWDKSAWSLTENPRSGRRGRHRGKTACKGAVRVPARPRPPCHSFQLPSLDSPTRHKTKTSTATPEVPPHPQLPTRKRPNPDPPLARGSRLIMTLFPAPIVGPPERCLGDQEARATPHSLRDTNYINQKDRPVATPVLTNESSGDGHFRASVGL